MFEIETLDNGYVAVSGRLDAAQAERAQTFLDQVEGEYAIDMGALEYVSSAGLGVLLKAHKRLLQSGSGLRLVNVNSHINDIFRYSGFDRLFTIELAAG